MFHAALVTLKECSETSTIIHDKGATFGTLCGNVVSQVQEKLRNGTDAEREGSHHTVCPPSPGPVGHPGSPDSVGPC